jgi:hypothetical protein
MASKKRVRAWPTTYARYGFCTPHGSFAILLQGALMRVQDSSVRPSGFLKGLGVVLLPLLVIGAVGRGPASRIGVPLPGSYSLTFSGDASFQGPHGGQPIHVTVETTDGKRVASQDGTVSRTADPSFSFHFADVLQPHMSYVIKYWIDSNFHGGTVGKCDKPSVDHQWAIRPSDKPALADVAGNVTIEDSHRPAAVEDVCSK